MYVLWYSVTLQSQNILLLDCVRLTYIRVIILTNLRTYYHLLCFMACYVLNQHGRTSVSLALFLKPTWLYLSYILICKKRSCDVFILNFAFRLPLPLLSLVKVWPHLVLVCDNSLYTMTTGIIILCSNFIDQFVNCYTNGTSLKQTLCEISHC